MSLTTTNHSSSSSKSFTTNRFKLSKLPQLLPLRRQVTSLGCHLSTSCRQQVEVVSGPKLSSSSHQTATLQLLPRLRSLSGRNCPSSLPQTDNTARQQLLLLPLQQMRPLPIPELL